MTSKHLILFLFLLLGFTSCQNEFSCNEPSEGQAFCGFGETPGDCLVEGNETNQPEILENRSFSCRAIDHPGSYMDDPATLWNLEINEDCLDLKVRFGGSHLNHQFFLVWDGNFIQETIPTARLRLFHDHGNDFGEALLLRRIRRDLTEVRHPGGNQVQIIVENYQGETLSALYEY